MGMLPDDCIAVVVLDEVERVAGGFHVGLIMAKQRRADGRPDFDQANGAVVAKAFVQATQDGDEIEDIDQITLAHILCAEDGIEVWLYCGEDADPKFIVYARPDQVAKYNSARW